MKLPEGKTIAMPRDLLNQWLHALDTEMYPKGCGSMKSDGAYCCLGVLQMVACGSVEQGDDDLTYSLGYPTPEWKEEHKVVFVGGSADGAPNIPSVGELTIADMNDERVLQIVKTLFDGEELPQVYTFPQIADFIRLHSIALEDLKDEDAA